MTASHPDITVSLDAGSAVLALPPRLESALEDSLVEALQEALATSPRLLIFDFSSVEAATSSGIGLLIDGLRRADEHHVEVALAAVGGQPLLVLRRIGLLHRLAAHETVAAAKASARP